MKYPVQKSTFHFTRKMIYDIIKQKKMADDNKEVEDLAGGENPFKISNRPTLDLKRLWTLNTNIFSMPA